MIVEYLEHSADIWGAFDQETIISLFLKESRKLFSEKYSQQNCNVGDRETVVDLFYIGSVKYSVVDLDELASLALTEYLTIQSFDGLEGQWGVHEKRFS